MLEVGEQQFLMLLLMLDAKLDERQRRGRQVGQCSLYRRIDMRAPNADFVERRPRQQAATRAGVARPLGPVSYTQLDVYKRQAEGGRFGEDQGKGGIDIIPCRKRGPARRAQQQIGVARTIFMAVLAVDRFARGHLIDLAIDREGHRARRCLLYTSRCV